MIYNFHKNSLTNLYHSQMAKVAGKSAAALPQLQAAKLDAVISLNIGLINSAHIEGIELSLDSLDDIEAEDDDG